jgi:hypothetical protein
MQDLTTHSAVLTAQGKPNGEPATPIEASYRALRGIKDRLNDTTGAHVLAHQQAQAVVDQVTPGANAKVRRMADMARGTLIYLDAALEAAVELDADLGNAAEAVRQAAIEDNQRRAAWDDMRAEAQAYMEEAATARSERQEYADLCAIWEARAKHWAVLCFCAGVGLGGVAALTAMVVLW